jgi:polysaccharide biosynthesis protein PslH
LRTRPYYLLKTLAARHEITVISPTFNQKEEADARELEEKIAGLKVIAVKSAKTTAIKNSLLALPKGLPMQARYCYNPQLVAVVGDLIRSGQFDLAHVEHFRAAYIGEIFRRLNFPAVYDAVDCISLLVERTMKHGSLKNRLISRVELNNTRKYEKQILQNGNFRAFCATSREDAESLAGLAGGIAVEVVPNGVDINYFSPPGAESSREAATVVFSGKMSYHSNAAAARFLINEIWGSVRRRSPQAQLWIVGSNPPQDLVALSGKHGVTVTGYVPDVRDYLRRATLAVAPMLYSVGIQNKVLEAMACGTPVIASGSVSRAISARAGEEICLVDSANPVEFAAQINRLLNQPELTYRMGQYGRGFVVRQHTWEGAAAKLENLWSKTLASSQTERTLAIYR